MRIADSILPLEEWFQKLPEYLPATDVNEIKKAYQVAAAAHEGQVRASGEVYITHSLTVAQILAGLKLEGEVIIAALLHDVPEDTEVTLEEIRHTFGPKVAQLVDGVTKFKRASTFKGSPNSAKTPSRQEDEQAENLRKMLLAIGDDVRVVLIKLADRLHNMRTLAHLPEHKQQRIARETMDIYAPLANRLGIDAIKSELENRSFKYLHPQEYLDIARKLEANRAEMDTRIKKIATELTQILAEAEIQATLSWRTKRLYSIYLKMQRKEVNITQIYDVKALRVVVNNVRDCYAALGQAHSKWRPIAGEFDDYIAAPKENGYQSLHTAVVHQSGQQFEIQIRTKKMHQQAKLGIAAHWRYKDGSTYDLALAQKIAQMRQAIRLQAEGEGGGTASEFVNGVKSDIFEEKVYIFTPKGDIHELPLGSTPIDFAYSIHTEVGHKCRGAKINGTLVGLDYQLKNSDKVEILTAKRGGPSRDWLNDNLGYIKTSRARRKIKHWFKKQNYQESVSQGRFILERELKRLNITDVKYENLAMICNYKKTDDFLAALGFDDLSIQHVIRKALGLSDLVRKEQEQAPPLISTPSPPATDAVTVMGVGNLLTVMARCCNPIPGDPITGYVTRGKGVTVHRKDCLNILRQTDKERLIQVDWGVQKAQTHPVPLIINAFDRPGLIRDVSEIIANEQLNMTSITVSVKNYTASLWVTVEVPDIDQLRKIMDKIEQLPNVIEVNRKR